MCDVSQVTLFVMSTLAIFPFFSNVSFFHDLDSDSDSDVAAAMAQFSFGPEDWSTPLNGRYCLKKKRNQKKKLRSPS